MTQGARLVGLACHIPAAGGRGGGGGGSDRTRDPDQSARHRG